MIIKKKLMAAIGLFTVASSAGLCADDTQTLTVEYYLDKAVQAIWQGGDTTETGGGDGKVVLEPGVPKTAVLKVQCNSTNGYNVKFSTTTASASDTAVLLTDGGGSSTKEIPYSAALDLSAISQATAIGSLNLQDTNNDDVAVTFPNAGDVLPMDSASAHEVKLVISLGSFDPYFKEEGLYQDTITATVAIN